MQTIHSRTYTNVALTVLILLMLALVARPYVSLPKAYAGSLDSLTSKTPQDDKTMLDGQGAQIRSALLVDPYADVAKALREIAASNKEVADAIRETAKSQYEVSHSIGAIVSAVSAASSSGK